MKKTLIVIDMQNDFIDGSLGTKEAVAIVPNVLDKIKASKDAGDRIIFTRDTHFENYMDTQEGKKLPVKHCIKGTDGWQIREGLCEAAYDNKEEATIIDKKSFGFTDWKGILGNDYDGEIELIGLCTDICVVSNALIIKALYPEARVSVDSKCCAGVTPVLHDSALKTMGSCQVDII